MIAKILMRILPARFRRLLNKLAGNAIDAVPYLALPYCWFLFGVTISPAAQGRFLIGYKGIKLLYPDMNYGVFISIVRHNLYEQLLSILEGDTVIDIGAHVGTFTVKAAKATGATGQVIAIEPEPKNLALLKDNVKNNGLANVKIVGKAAGSSRRKAKLYLSNSDEAHSLIEVSDNYIEVKVDSLDNIVSELGLSQVDFIKIDAEGAELEILKGAQRTLAYPRVKLALAAYHRLPDGTTQSPVIESYLKSLGFKIYAETGGEDIYVYAARREEYFSASSDIV